MVRKPIFREFGGAGIPTGRQATSAAGGEIVVYHGNNVRAGTYPTMDEALAEASRLAGFQVLPAAGLPGGFSVSSINVLGPVSPSPTPAVRAVQLLVRSDSGGLLITQSNGATRFDDAAERIVTPGGDYYATGPADSRTYSLVTANRTFTVLARGNIPQAQALAILGGFRP